MLKTSGIIAPAIVPRIFTKLNHQKYYYHLCDKVNQKGRKRKCLANIVDRFEQTY